MVNDPLYLASSDHPGMMLTNTPFNGGNFISWSRTIKMALGAKLKLGFIDGSSPKPAVIDVDYKRWVRCDYMVTCWILNSMVAELSESFLYAQSARDLWKELEERYCQSNGPLIYHVERELSKVTQGNSTIAAYFNKLKKFWDELHSLNGIPVCSCGKIRECTCGITDKFLEIDTRSKLMQFLMRLDDDFKAEFSPQELITEVMGEMILEDKGLRRSFVLVVIRKDICMSCVLKGWGILIGTRERKTRKMFKGKGIDPSYIDSTSQPHADLRVDWIVDTGASDHMSPHLHLFHSIRVLKKPIKIRLPDGTSKWDPSTSKVLTVGEGYNNLYICKPSSNLTSC
ncbi:hypothetical protein Tco_0078895 [Tanacetum coccineum]